jgi:hypothetical protein
VAANPFAGEEEIIAGEEERARSEVPVMLPLLRDNFAASVTAKFHRG